MKKANSTDPVKVAHALEGLKVESMNGTVEMRNTDHQAQQPLVVATWTKVDGKEVKYDAENTGYGWKTNAELEPVRGRPAHVLPDEAPGLIRRATGTERSGADGPSAPDRRTITLLRWAPHVPPKDPPWNFSSFH